MRATIRSLHIPRQTPGTLAEIAQQINPLLRGWIGYYGRFSRSALFSLVDYVNQSKRDFLRTPAVLMDCPGIGRYRAVQAVAALWKLKGSRSVISASPAR
ncbi:hypothetical protein HAP41_0000004860 [Bradyrhizobium barranii subsp. apii]|uniref:Group II intron maturase-specific domain-containing protein n=1 Tax=Bradyrhizobium barranii subsp. apii TaxID=2819348 RepID=A0A8U0FZS4_9BRAD|nr:group II intron maturase-specific domain-containing protein [Bradyrhizobium barranii]UPT92059.1 hypothetical protein HAP41_0000004860 [Bradyrhizobium barranii subsp. apii]